VLVGEQLGLAYVVGYYGVPMDRTTGIKWLALAAIQGPSMRAPGIDLFERSHLHGPATRELRFYGSECPMKSSGGIPHSSADGSG
jgi:hypothetical protein